jgi:fluoroacetyl-CoA thioesterase
MTITVNVRLDKVEGRKLTFTLSAHDGVDKISEGTHIRHVIDVDRFNAKLSAKAKKLKAE